MESKGHILIADDDASFAQAAAGLLRVRGYTCDCAVDGATAAERLRTGAYELLISDLEMPGNSQLELIREVPQLARGLPVIILTGHPTLESAIGSVQLKVAAYLTKPVEPAALEACVAEALEQARAFRRVRESRERLGAWSRDLAALETQLRVAKGGDMGGAWEVFLDITVRNLAASLLDLRQMLEVWSRRQQAGGEWMDFKGAQPVVLIEALRDTIMALERTKSAFKSKELGDLRKRLEALVRPPSNPRG